MLSDYFEIMEKVGLSIFFIGLFLLINLAIRDILKKTQTSRLGQITVWTVLFLGCGSFFIKGLIHIVWIQ